MQVHQHSKGLPTVRRRRDNVRIHMQDGNLFDVPIIMEVALGRSHV
ncbi:MAG: hypothetical protein GY696_07400 [Gammaproteobacteria bacterium]|nr:hypothetical protein [Gammaproteobacteria bacterium]